MSKSRAERVAALQHWADTVRTNDLIVADTEALRTIAELAQRRGDVDAALVDAVRAGQSCLRTLAVGCAAAAFEVLNGVTPRRFVLMPLIVVHVARSEAEPDRSTRPRWPSVDAGAGSTLLV